MESNIPAEIKNCFSRGGFCEVGKGDQLKTLETPKNYPDDITNVQA